MVSVFVVEQLVELEEGGRVEGVGHEEYFCAFVEPEQSFAVVDLFEPFDGGGVLVVGQVHLSRGRGTCILVLTVSKGNSRTIAASSAMADMKKGKMNLMSL